ncbi:MAG: outer membrane beta-barrel protein [Caulobacter sp.]|nr:outer membrane beta-barrel protein [Vitreoscilla sp.]
MITKIRILSAAALALAALSAHAQSADADAPTHWKFGVQLGTVQDHADTEPVAQVSLGYAFDRTWSVEALANVSLLFIRAGGQGPDDHQFDNAFGGRVLATLPLGERWNVVGGLGVVNFEDEIGNGTIFGSTHQHKTSPMVSLSTNYRLGRRWSLGVEASSFTAANTFNLGLRADFHF